MKMSLFIIILRTSLTTYHLLPILSPLRFESVALRRGPLIIHDPLLLLAGFLRLAKDCVENALNNTLNKALDKDLS